ncbi:hypothetical protein BBB56_17105 [Candidatus Pantoea deserta]|uniref:Uncharacterized protein n=1 Tax=Candidatus Pantoea deserta TaxID=1869313 RepID=A0A3N4P046_9GAMM|nr:hypothetical protein BBB56_17105 [Pantoea deserta]
MKKYITLDELRQKLLQDPAFRAAYETERQNPEPDYQIIRHHDDGSEELIYDSRQEKQTLNDFTERAGGITDDK